ncbi:MAG: hypothetical protein HOD47_12785, partial [Gammaproteobacteria bacterium]|nr:hypothetical protein [Gammaproteobacteria bacterium]
YLNQLSDENCKRIIAAKKKSILKKSAAEAAAKDVFSGAKLEGVGSECTDRAYRIGQKRDVHVHLPLAIYPDNPEHSFDLNLHHLLENKRSLSRTVLAPVVASDQDLSGLYEGTFFKESH